MTNPPQPPDPRFPVWDPHPHPLDLLACWLVPGLGDPHWSDAALYPRARTGGSCDRPECADPLRADPGSRSVLSGTDVPDPEGAREEAALYASLEDSLRTWARSWHVSPTPANRKPAKTNRKPGYDRHMHRLRPLPER